MHSLKSSDHLSGLCPHPKMYIGTDTVTFLQVSGQTNCPGILSASSKAPSSAIQSSRATAKRSGEINSNKKKEKKKYLQ